MRLKPEQKPGSSPSKRPTGPPAMREAAHAAALAVAVGGGLHFVASLLGRGSPGKQERTSRTAGATAAAGAEQTPPDVLLAVKQQLQLDPEFGEAGLIPSAEVPAAEAPSQPIASSAACGGDQAPQAPDSVAGDAAGAMDGAQAEQAEKDEQQQKEGKEGEAAAPPLVLAVDPSSTFPAAEPPSPLPATAPTPLPSPVKLPASPRPAFACPSPGTVAHAARQWKQQELDQLRQQVDAGQQRIRQLEAQLTLARHERKKVNSEVLEARQTVASTEKQLTAALELIASLESRAETLLMAKSTAERSSNELKVQLTTVQTETASKSANLAHQVEQLSAQVAQLQREATDATNARQAAEAQIKTLRRHIAVLEEQHHRDAAALQRAQAAADSAKEELNKTRQAYETLQDEVEDHRLTAAQHNTELEDQKRVSDQNAAALAAAQAQLRKLESEARHVRKSYALLEAKLTCLAMGTARRQGQGQDSRAAHHHSGAHGH